MENIRYRLCLIGISILIFGAVAVFADAPDTLWTRTFGGSSWEVGYSAQQTTDGGYIIAGYTLSFGDPYGDVYLIKTYENGDTAWTRIYTGFGEDGARSVKQTSDGGYIVAGQTAFIGGYYDVYLIKTDPSGNIVWTYTYGGTGSDIAWDVEQTSDGGYILAGVTSSFGVGGRDVYLIKTLSNGVEDWSRTYGGSGWEYGHSVQQTSDGGYIIVGYTDSFGAGGDDIYLIKTDASGNLTFPPKTFGGTGGEQGHSVKQTSDGGYIIAAHTWSYGAGGADVYLLKTNASCDSVWARTYGGSDWDWGYSVQQTADEGYIVAGYTNSYGEGGRDIYLVKTDAYGDTAWTKTCGGINDEEGYEVQQTFDGGYIVAGYTASFGLGGNDVYLVRLKPGTDELGFHPGHHDWQFANTEVNMWPESWWSQFDYTQPPYPVWFQFLYQLTSSSVFPDWPLFVSAFGEDQCYCDPPLIYSIEAENVWCSIIGPWSGSCFGFAISSLLFFDNYLNLQTEFPGYDSLYSVPINDESRMMVNKYWIYQFGKAQQQNINDNWLTTTPAQTLAACYAMFTPGVDSRILVLFNNYGFGGHAVVPYKLEVDPIDPEINYLYVYDCNFPGDDTKRIVIDTDANTWFYNVFPNWGGDKFLFLMDPIGNYTTNPMLPKSIPPLERWIGKKTPKVSDYVKFYVLPTENAILESPAGNIGRVGDSLFSTLTDGFPIIPITGQETPPIGYYLPNDIWNSQFSGAEDSIFWLSMITDSIVISYWRSGVDDSETEQFRYPGNDSTFLVLNPDGENRMYDVHLISICPDSEIFYIVNDISTEPGDSNRYAIKPGSQLQLDNYGEDKDYNLRIEIPSENGAPVFFHEGIILSENSSHLVIPDWRQNNDSLIILVDSGMTGDFSDTISYDNEGDIGIYENPQTVFLTPICEPNPFRNVTSIKYSLAKSTNVHIVIYDLIGREVRELLNKMENKGVHSLIWDGRDNSGRRVPSGVYFLRFEADQSKQTSKLLMMR